jgi:hypothetical protein
LYVNFLVPDENRHSSESKYLEEFQHGEREIC